MPVMVPIMLPRPRLMSMKKNMTDQNGDAGKWVMASVKAMKASPVPWTDCRETVRCEKYRTRYRFNCSGTVPKTRLVELVLQDTRLQTQLGEAALFHRLDDPVHLSVVCCGEMGEVHMWRDEIVAQDVRVKVS